MLFLVQRTVPDVTDEFVHVHMQFDPNMYIYPPYNKPAFDDSSDGANII